MDPYCGIMETVACRNAVYEIKWEIPTILMVVSVNRIVRSSPWPEMTPGPLAGTWSPEACPMSSFMVPLMMCVYDIALSEEAISALFRTSNRILACGNIATV